MKTLNIITDNTDTLSNSSLDQRAVRMAGLYRKCEAELLGIILEVDQRKLFYGLGFNSLFSYMTERLKLTPAMAYNFQGVARKSHEVPELKEQVLSGKISVSKARKLVPVITKGNHNSWFEAARQKTSRSLERDIAMASPKNAISDKIAYVPEAKEKHEAIKICQQIPRVQVQIGVSEAIMLKLRRAQDLESQKSKSNKGLEETLDAILDVYLEKRDPVRKAARQKNRGKLQTGTIEPELQNQKPSVEVSSNSDIKQRLLVPDQSKNKKRKRNIPAKVLHQLQLRDEGRCAYVDVKTGRRCSSQRYLEAHHIRPFSSGGKHSLDNLTLLCSGHHKALHRKEPV